MKYFSAIEIFKNLTVTPNVYHSQVHSKWPPKMVSCINFFCKILNCNKQNSTGVFAIETSNYFGHICCSTDQSNETKLVAHARCCNGKFYFGLKTIKCTINVQIRN